MAATKALLTPRLRQLVDSGIPLAMTTDAFRAASFNPWVGISWMVSGKSISGTEVLAKDNRLSRAEALRLFTRGAAWFLNAESEMGMIAQGHLADFALLDRITSRWRSRGSIHCLRPDRNGWPGRVRRAELSIAFTGIA